MKGRSVGRDGERKEKVIDRSKGEGRSNERTDPRKATKKEQPEDVPVPACDDKIDDRKKKKEGSREGGRSRQPNIDRRAEKRPRGNSLPSGAADADGE